MIKKTQADVGKDFDAYAKKWQKVGYDLEIKGDHGQLLGREKSEAVKRPGDEWGLQSDLRDVYVQLYKKFHKPGGNVLEIGSGAGRLTEVALDDNRETISEYHTLDPSSEMTKHLRERTKPGNVKLINHIGGSAYLESLPKKHFGLAYSQSCWSHINLYDQYLYLRDLRKVIAPGGVFFVNGIFMIGGCTDWTFDRFKRRVGQHEAGTSASITKSPASA